MGELSKKLHYKKTDGTQGEVSIYDSLEDCPVPNLKVKVDGIQGYVKLGTADDGETVPIKVKTSTAGVLNVIKTTVPTGSWRIKSKETKSLTIPLGVRVVHAYRSAKGDGTYVGVTPGKTYKFEFWVYRIGGNNTKYIRSLKCLTTSKTWLASTRKFGLPHGDFIIEWSPEINNQAPNKTDYITD